MSLLGTEWLDVSTGDRSTVVSDEDDNRHNSLYRWIGLKQTYGTAGDIDCHTTRYMTASRLRDNYTQVCQPNMVNHPDHYKSNSSGVECVDVCETMPFVLGNALKYIWRYESNNGVEDLRKAQWYLRRLISNGHSTSLPHKARKLLSQVIDQEPSGSNPRVNLFTFLVAGRILEALELIDNLLKG